jgi:hypothetical protein
LFSLKISGRHLKARLAIRALDQFLDATDGNHRNDKKEGDETHALLHDEVGDGPTLAATHGLRGLLRTPVEKVCADDEDEEHAIANPP